MTLNLLVEQLGLESEFVDSSFLPSSFFFFFLVRNLIFILNTEKLLFVSWRMR